ncbi:MAG: hypothetical protein JWO57_1880 [Pseudonocardiales bacterium]|jgi:hypothetical protein|nr:hypothetical protein [Pseudonocardiales bacterium]
MVNQLSTPGADEMSPRTTPQSPAPDAAEIRTCGD